MTFGNFAVKIKMLRFFKSILYVLFYFLEIKTFKHFFHFITGVENNAYIRNVGRTYIFFPFFPLQLKLTRKLPKFSSLTASPSWSSSIETSSKL